jgi:nucleotide-binding universal stress UspA family protein
MFKNVLVGVNGGPHGRDAIALARRLAAPGGKLTLANVFSGSTRPIDAVTPGMVEEDRAHALQTLEHERAAAGVEAELLAIDAMRPGEGLHLAAEKRGADLLVVGFKRVMLGDDARASLNGAPCAVAVAPSGYGELGAPIARIGVAYDGSPESVAALATARALAAQAGAEVRALHVVSVSYYEYMGMMAPSGGGIDELIKDADKEMKALPGVTGRAEYGLAGEELSLFSGEVDLLIVGSRNYGPVRRLMLGSTSNHLQRHARCPLLILPRGTEHGAHEAAADEAGAPVAVPA